MSIDLKYTTIRLSEQKSLPNQTEQRQALERRIGDWFLAMQPANKSFPATHQLHTRGIWSEDTRKEILKKIKDTERLPSQSKNNELEKIWKENKISRLKSSFEALKNAVRNAQDLRQDVSSEVDKRLDTKYPGMRTMLRLLDEDRLVNRANAHTELRSVSPDGKFLIGWTLQTPGVMTQFLKSGKLEQVGRNKLLEFGKKIDIPGQDKIAIDRIQVAKKSPQPLKWLDLVTKQDPEFEAEIGEVGATESTAGKFEFITGGGEPFEKEGAGRVGFSVVYGVRRNDFHEQFHFYEDPKLQDLIGGRWTFRLVTLKGEGDEPESDRWLARKTDDPEPFIFNNDFEEEKKQAQKEKNDMFWNFEAIKALENLGYFKSFDIEDKLKEFEQSDRGKKPPSNGVIRFRPKGKLSKVTDIFGD